MLFRKLKKGSNGNPKGLPLPPGPKGYPLIGNLLDIPIDKPWLVYEKSYKTYGDMVYFSAFGPHFLVLGSLKWTTDLLEKRSSNYSNRMRFPMAVERMNWDFNMVFLPYGAWWRRHRRSFHEYFHPNAAFKYLPIQRREIHAFLHRLLVTPDNFLQHVRHTFAATIMNIAYVIEVQDSDDPYILLAERSLNGLSQAGIRGTYWVDFFPILKYVPSWFPGAGFQKKAAHWREINASVAEKVKSGKAAPSVAATLIERLPQEDDPQRLIEERLAKNVAAVAYLGPVML